MPRPPQPLLEKGQLVGVVAPGFAVPHRPLREGLRRLEAMGYRTRPGRHLHARDGYFAGDDAARLDDLNDMVRDPAVRAIWFARGGWGSARLLDGVDWRALRRKPKPLIGYSDLTSLFAVATRRSRALCLYGPVVVELGDPGSYHAPSLRALLAGREISVPFRARQVLRHGRARGRLAGGNLTVLTHLLGTPHAPRLRDAVLLLEDVGEEAYRLDRMLTQLRSSGMLSEVRGVIVGTFDAPARRRFPPDRDPLELVRETFLPLGVPVVVGLPVGHGRAKRTLPLGGRVELQTRAGKLRAWPRS